MRIWYTFLSILPFLRRTETQEEGQHFLFFEKCPPRYCPIDCVRVSSPDDCSSCHCPEGYRCPTVICPAGISALDCGRIQTMDGCESCLCNKPAFSIYTEQSHTLRFYLGRPPAFTRAEATCEVEDVAVLSRCMEQLHKYYKFHWIRNPDIALSTLPWMKFRKDHFEEFCELLDQIPRCTGPDVIKRCKDQESKLSSMMTVYEFPCLSHRQEFFMEYDCLHNIMAGHRTMRACENTLEARMHKARKGDYRLKEKIKEKCDAFNDFLRCARFTTQIFCGPHAWDMFAGAFMASAPMTAPECNLEREVFTPKHLREAFTSLDVPQTSTTPPTTTTPEASTATLSVILPPTGFRQRASPAEKTWVLVKPEVIHSRAPVVETLLQVHGSSAATQNAVVQLNLTLTDPLTRQRNYGSHALQERRISKKRSGHSRIPTHIERPASLSNGISTTLRPPLAQFIQFHGKKRKRPAKSGASFDSKCDRMLPRVFCENGSRPQRVLRWFRPEGGDACESYQYAYCAREETRATTIKYEQSCYEECFDDLERAEMDSLKNLRFESGFRVDDDHEQ